MTELQILTNLISNIGFPIAVAGYLLTRFEKKMKENTEAIQSMIKLVKEMSKK